MIDSDSFLGAGSQSNLEVLQLPATSDCQSLAGSTNRRTSALVQVSTKQDLHAVLQVSFYSLHVSKTAADRRSNPEQNEKRLPAGSSRILYVATQLEPACL